LTARIRIRQGDLWLVDFGHPVGHEQGFVRPAIVVSSDRMNNSAAGLVIVVPLTTRQRGLPSHIAIGTGETGLREESYAKVEDIKSISVERCSRRIGRADDTALERIRSVARLLLDL
jgi:mRNA interferase MazF